MYKHLVDFSTVSYGNVEFGRRPGSPNKKGKKPNNIIKRDLGVVLGTGALGTALGTGAGYLLRRPRAAEIAAAKMLPEANKHLRTLKYRGIDGASSGALLGSIGGTILGTKILDNKYKNESNLIQNLYKNKNKK